VALPVDLPAKRGPLSALQLVLGEVQKFSFSFLGTDPQPEVEIEN